MDNSFQQLRRSKGLTSREVADAAGVSLADEYLFEIGGIVKTEVGRKIQEAFETLTGERSPIEDQPTTLLNRLGGPHAIPTRTNRKDREHQNYD